MSAQAERGGIVDVHTLARLFQSAQVTRHKDTVHADVVNDLVLCRFLLGQLFGHALNPDAVRDCCRQTLLANVQGYLTERGYLSATEAK